MTASESAGANDYLWVRWGGVHHAVRAFRLTGAVPWAAFCVAEPVCGRGPVETMTCRVALCSPNALRVGRRRVCKACRVAVTRAAVNMGDL